MAKYYGIQRSEEYLVHYGIKGMKWGVQKAKVAGNDKALSKQYMKASKKLEKLNRKADVNYQRAQAKKYDDKRKLSALDTAIAGSYTGAKALAANRLSLIGAGATAVGIGRSIYNTSRMAYHKHKAGVAGHVKAAAKRDNFKREMNEAFKGTKYGSKTTNKQIKNKAVADSNRVAEAEKNLSYLGKKGFGKTAKEYRNAKIAARESTKQYYDSLSKKQYAKLRRNHVG